MSKRLRSVGVTVGLVLTAGMTFACASDQESDSDYGQVCMEEATQLRASDEKCGDDNGHGGHAGHHWMYLGRGHSAPPVGTKLKPGTYTSVRPAGGSIARPPASGGFGRTVTSGGG